MNVVVVDRRLQAGGALFGCLEQVNAVGRCRDWIQADQERFGWVKVFCLVLVWFFFPRIWIYILLFFQEFTRRATWR